VLFQPPFTFFTAVGRDRTGSGGAHGSGAGPSGPPRVSGVGPGPGDSPHRVDGSARFSSAHQLRAGSPSRVPRRARGDPEWRSVAGVTRGSAHQSSAANESPGWSGRQPPPTWAESRHRDSPHRGADSATPAPESALKTRAEWPRKVGESPCARGPVGAVWGGVGTLLGRLGGLRKATRADTGATRTHRGRLEGPTRRTRRAHSDSLGRVGPSPVASRPRRVRLAALPLAPCTRAPLGGPHPTRPRATTVRAATSCASPSYNTLNRVSARLANNTQNT
jgi:hypothetical protein